MLRRIPFVLFALAILLAAASSLAAPLDSAANKKIDEAVNQHYLATSFNKAESILLGTVKACGRRCSASVLARAWMYVGIVRGSGKNDLDGAKKAFAYAVYVDSDVKLDAALATPETKAAFRQAKASGGTAPPAGAAEPPPPSPEPGPTGSPTPPPSSDARGLECSPTTREVQTRRPIPMQCTSSAEATRGEIRFKEYGGEQWQTTPLEKRGATFQGRIPCDATMLAGRLQVHVVLLDAAGNVADSLGSLNNPMIFSVVPETKEAPPSLPGQDPPGRCAEPVECPPDFPGCNAARGSKEWGDACDEDTECRRGLVCAAGQCENAESCESDADCGEGMCVAGACEQTAIPGSKLYKENWVGVHVAQDFTPIGGQSVCSADAQTNQGYACFQNGTQPVLPSQVTLIPAEQGQIENGVALATTRFVASFERAFTPNITLGARVGYAIGGGPTTNDGTAYMPFHAELRGSYYFIGLNERFRPYVAAGGGLAQVDTKVSNVQVRAIDGVNVIPVDVWKKAGQAFGAGSLGMAIALSETIAAKVNVNGMVLLPSFGLSIEPSVGLLLGF